MKHDKIVVGITQGDINSISYEVIIKTLMEPRIFDICIPVVYGSPKVAAYHRKALNINNFSFNTIKSVDEANFKRANIINCNDEEIRVDLGHSTDIAGQASAQALEFAVKDIREKKIDVLVTGPINKHNIQSDTFKYAGHTEFFKDQFEAEEVLMIMASDALKVGVVTGHIPITEVPIQLTKSNIYNKIQLLNKSLIKDFGIRKPRIAVLGLNPHAGENGLIGNEEKDVIIPAIKELASKNISVFGPYPADGFFGSGNFYKFDAVLAMYHDQGLIPFKALIPEGGVNYTAGLPIIRTSPAHGTAYELTGKDQASPDAFRNALYMACDIYKNRAMLHDLTQNPMKNYDISNI